MAGWD
jgi:hypothetical protein